jgi:hypothetical protein
MFGERTIDKLLYGDIEQRISTLSDQLDVRSPIYVPSRHRPDVSMTTKLFDDAGLDYFLVVEPHDHEDYLKHHPEERLVVMDQDDQGLWYARNFAMNHANQNGHLYCWQFDDDMKSFVYRVDGKMYKTSPRHLMSIVEQTTFQFSNVGGAGIGNAGFIFGYDHKPPVVYNAMIFQAMLLRTDTGLGFRPDVTEDADYSLQLLHAGWVTLTFKRIGQSTAPTMSVKGGMTDKEYAGDGRLKNFNQLLEYFPNSYKIGYRPDGRPHLRYTGYYKQFTQLPRPLPSPEHLLQK